MTGEIWIPGGSRESSSGAGKAAAGDKAAARTDDFSLVFVVVFIVIVTVTVVIRQSLGILRQGKQKPDKPTGRLCPGPCTRQLLY